MENKKKKVIKFIIATSVMIIIPFLVGLLLSSIFERKQIIEAVFVMFGLVYLIALFVRIRIKDRKNWKESRTVFNDKKSKEFKNFMMIQYYLLIMAAVMFILSLIFFLIYGKGQVGSSEEESLETIESLVLYLS